MVSRAGQTYIGKSFNFRHSGRVVTVQELLGEGGFSLVFLVTTGANHRYALKRMCVNNQHDLETCRREIAIVKSTYGGHKNAVTFVDSMETVLKGGIFEVLLLMEYCSDIMNKHIDTRLTEDHCLKIFCDVCEAIAKLHLRRIPIVHRDLKVENVLLSGEGDYKLCDFGSTILGEVKPLVEGVGKVQEELDKYTTLSYRSPEMVDLYSGLAIGPKADIWALGCLLYKLCFFTCPFGDSILGIQSGSFSFPDSSQYSMGMHSLIAYMLEPNPAKRPNICQVSHIAFKLRGLSCPVPNVFKIPLPEKLPGVPQEVKPRQKRDKTPVPASTSATSERSVPSTGTPRPRERPVPATATSLTPRERPRAGGNTSSLPTPQQVVAPSMQKPITRSRSENIGMPPSSPYMGQSVVKPVFASAQHGHLPNSVVAQPAIRNNIFVHKQHGMPMPQPRLEVSGSSSAFINQQGHGNSFPQRVRNNAYPVSNCLAETSDHELPPFRVDKQPSRSESDSQLSSHYAVPETDVFGAKPFCATVQKMDDAVDSFGSVPFGAIVSTKHLPSGDSLRSMTDAFGSLPFTPNIDGTRPYSSSGCRSSASENERDGIRSVLRSSSESPPYLSDNAVGAPHDRSGFYLPITDEPARPNTAPQSPVHDRTLSGLEPSTSPACGVPRVASLIAISHPEERLSREASPVYSPDGLGSRNLDATTESHATPTVVLTDDKGLAVDEFGAFPFEAAIAQPSLDPFGFEPFNPIKEHVHQRFGRRDRRSVRLSGSLEDLSTVIGNPAANKELSRGNMSALVTPGDLKKAKSQEVLAGTPV
ncbi:AP2-associated protein kinase 1-like isoform X2 [Corticium candelabrum]|uniref:AP2-associated protein kinase 1-like isoform X2 n=1 Tax=Corticium candelabrum TaxID=121492 RepID=UPI002E26D0E7|nr:AP2-associated protein kinase 1-like isoform X2 [Corticium candelabrum]